MTLSIGALTRDEIWLLSDRRISYRDKEPWDEAIKVFELVATDGYLLASYAGLGMTVGGMEPSEWLSNCLRNRKLSVAEALAYIAELVETHFARQLRSVEWSSPQHVFHFVAKVDGKTKGFYIALLRVPETGEVLIQKKVLLLDLSRPRAPKSHLQIAGTNLSKWEYRDVQRAIRERAAGRLSPTATAKALAAVNHCVSSRLTNKTVGPRCIVTFKDALGGGQSWFFTGTTQDRVSPGLPCITRGLDMRALFAGVMEQSMQIAKRNEAEMREAMARKDHNKVQELLMQNLSRFPDMLAANVRAMPKEPDTSIE